MKIVCVLTEKQAEILRDIQYETRCSLELLRNEIKNTTIKENNTIKEIIDRMVVLNETMEDILVSE